MTSSLSLRPPAPEPSARRPLLDVLRGAAVLAVFLRHLGDRFRPFVIERAGRRLAPEAVRWLALALERAHWGVDLFFVLSGFTLGLGFVRAHARGGLPPSTAFFWRRAARILPGFYVALLVHLAARPELLHAARLGAALASHALLLQGYWGPGKIVLIGAAWSLTTEAQFYLLAPMFARWLLGSAASHRATHAARQERGAHAAPLTRRAHQLAIVSGVCVAVWLLRGLLHDWALGLAARPAALELTQRRLVVCRFDQFALGFGAALLHEARPAGRALRAWLGTGGLGLGLALLALAVPLDARTWGAPGGNAPYALVSLGMALSVYGASLLPDRAAAPLEPLRALGVVSYGVFLYHQLALELVSRWLPWARGESWSALAWTSLPALALAVAAGVASWHAIEARALAFVSGAAFRRLLAPRDFVGGRCQEADQARGETRR